MGNRDTPMNPRDVIPVIIRTTVKLVLLISVLCSALLMSADQMTTVTGEVTYVTSQSFYSNLGRNEGISVGDTLQVTRDSVFLTAGTVTNVSSKSSVCEFSGDVELQIGDSVMTRIITSPEQKPDVKPADSILTTRLKSRLSGSVSLRSNQSDASSGDLVTRNYALLNLTWSNLMGLPLNLTFYGRTTYETETVQSGMYWHLLRLQYHPGSFHVNAGRVYIPGMSGIGAVDGVDVSTSYRSFNYGFLAGLKPGTDSKSKKYGGYLKYDSARREIPDINIAFVQETSDSLDSPVFTANASIQPWKFLSVYSNFIVNLPANGSSAEFSTANVRLSLNWKSWIRSSLYYNYTASNLYTVIEPTAADSLPGDLSRHTMGASVYSRLPWKSSVSATVSQVEMQGQGSVLENYRVRLTRHDVLNTRTDIHAGIRMLSGEFYDILGGEISADYSHPLFDLEAGSRIESYSYGVGGETKSRISYEVNLSAPLWKNFYTSLYVDYSTSDDEDLLYTAFQLTYRFR